jgi:RNA polymerase sigma-70 factor, ECF subfamily
MRNEDATWESFCLLSYGKLLARARKLTNGDVDKAGDLVQETILRILSYPPILADIKEPLAYLFRIMRNAWVDQARRMIGIHLESLDDPLNVELHKKLPVVQPEVQRNLENKELLEAIKRLRGGLSPREKRLLKLIVEGKEREEIAHIVGEDVRIIRADWNALMAKLRYRAQKAKGNFK